MALGIPKSKSQPKKASSKPAAKRSLNGGATRGAASFNAFSQQRPSSTPSAAAPNVTPATYSTPGATAAVTPIAAPPVVSDPFLTPTDMAQQALDLANVDQYLSDVALSTNNARTDAALKTSQIDTAEGRNLEQADWNNAARGLAQSSVKDQQKASLSADAAASRSGTAGNLKNATDYEASAQLRSNSIVKPAINSKYTELANRNAQEKTDREAAAWREANPAAAAAGEAPPASAPAGSSAPSAPSLNGGANRNSVAFNAFSQQQAWKPVVKNGNFYHYYPSTGQYMFIRKQS